MRALETRYERLIFSWCTCTRVGRWANTSHPMYSDADDKRAGISSIKGTETGDFQIHVRHLGGGGGV